MILRPCDFGKTSELKGCVHQIEKVEDVVQLTYLGLISRLLMIRSQ